MISVLDEILKEARNAGAGNVHLTVDCPPVMRIGNRLERMKYPPLTASDTLDIVLYVMNEAQRELFESRKEAEVSFEAEGGERYRITAYRQKSSAALSVRILKHPVPALTELGVDEQIMAFCGQAKGLVVVTGGSGSGKSTTIASMIETINESQQKLILTIGNPVEYRHENNNSVIVQREAGADTESVVSALKEALRADVDVIAVNGVRGGEAIDAVLTAVETGHLVFVEIPAADIAGAVDRLTAEYPAGDRALLKARLSKIPFAVISQKLHYGENGDRVTPECKVLKNNLWD